MHKVYVTVGIYSNLSEAKLIEMSLPHIPRIGDMIAPNNELKELMESKRKEWDMPSSVIINYVKVIAYRDKSEYPVIMLGGNPQHITVDIIYKEKVIASYLPAIPEIGDSIFVEQFNKDYYMYVQYIYYSAHSNIVTIRVDNDQKRYREVSVYNKVEVSVENTYPIPVEVMNHGSIPVEINGHRTGSIPVEVTNYVVPVEVKR